MSGTIERSDGATRSLRAGQADGRLRDARGDAGGRALQGKPVENPHMVKLGVSPPRRDTSKRCRALRECPVLSPLTQTLMCLGTALPTSVHSGIGSASLPASGPSANLRTCFEPRCPRQRENRAGHDGIGQVSSTAV